ncbi:uncharacterized protein LOC108916950 [Anoplophora glabripennis]|uniref:uncharacterized protein LOC108916950 n=1 Tax=Anoplophora glabripennis TaxID=217634 RepID=UPI0008758A1A|nr:uncharacterized protein LOC108916950 [Anoplophora glabripennis]
MGFQDSLIVAVRNNPVIFDKTMSNYKNLNAREIAWKAVGKELKVKDVLMLKRRWRTLRDAFIKQYRLYKLYESGQTRQQKRRKWGYYDQMLFLAPHIESKRPADSSYQEESLNYQYSQMANLDLGDESANMDFHEVENFSGQSSNQAETDFRKYDYPVGDGSKQQYFAPDGDKQTQLVVVPKQDADEQFMLSCVPILKRLSTRNNMLARMQIQSLLFNLEFGDNADVPAQRSDGAAGHAAQAVKCETVEVSPQSPTVKNAVVFTNASKNTPDNSQLIPSKVTDTSP